METKHKAKLLLIGTFGEQLTKLKRNTYEQEKIYLNGDCQMMTNVNVE